ncbi:glycosyltransferase [Plantibacter sp. lyk4-40-MEA-4]|uniref:glycosyltransferase n=1 Tax=Plantibacter sp. lyk4-40-MEA-4 TaxID=3040298 RepID=UPI0033079733
MTLARVCFKLTQRWLELGTDVTVCIVLFHTDPDLVERCISSIDQARDGSGLKVEIVVVDNSAEASLRARFESRTNVWIASPVNLGFGAASNLALTEANGDFVMFLNPDAALGAGALAALHGVAQQHRGDLIAGWLVSGSSVQVDGLMHWWSSTGRLIKRPSYRRYLETAALDLVSVQKVSGGAMFADRELLQRLGAFDERFFLYGEDADLSQRVLKGGGKLYALRTAQVEHVGASSQASHSTLVERARADAAIRLASYHLPRAQSLLTRLDLLAVTIIGLLPGLGRTSGSKASRAARLREIRRWGVRREAPRYSPVER